MCVSIHHCDGANACQVLYLLHESNLSVVNGKMHRRTSYTSVINWHACGDAFIRAICGALLIGVLCQMHTQLRLYENFLRTNEQLLYQQYEVLKRIASLRAKGRFLRTPDGMRMVAHLYGYLEPGERALRPVGAQSDVASIIDLLPGDAEAELDAILRDAERKQSDGAHQRGDSKVPQLNRARARRLMQTMRRRERVKRWLHRALHLQRCNDISSLPSS